MIPGPGDVKAQRLGVIQDSYFRQLGLLEPPSVGGSKYTTFRVREKGDVCPLAESWFLGVLWDHFFDHFSINFQSIFNQFYVYFYRNTRKAQ